MKYPLFSRTLLASVSRFVLAVLLVTLVSISYAADTDISELKIKAEQGDADAQAFLGLMYSEGEGIPKNYTEAAKWYRKAAEQGDVVAQSLLGHMYYNGQGVPKNYAEAIKWYRKAAEQGNAGAQLCLGIMYFLGQGVPKNYAEALKWYRKAAEQGNADAQLCLGGMYYNGRGVLKNYAEAMKWFRKAADQGDADAQFCLGGMYYNGQGVPKNYAEALKWLRKAADQGDANGQILLGGMYRLGQGVPQDYVQAYFWVNLAAAQGVEFAISQREEFSHLMTPAQIAKAQEMSATWKPKSFAASDKSKRPPGESEKPSIQPDQESQLISGTGFVVSREGHVLTNYHVVEGCTKIACDLSGKAVVLSLAQTDARNDLALLKLKEPGPIPLKFREGKSIRSGDGVVVVGYPLQGLLANQAHVTTGTVSAMAGRPGNDTRILQITAPVQPGNSGGPLLDMAGNVLGIVTAKLDAIKTAQLTGDLPQNVNFAINAAVVRAFLDANGIDYESANSNKKLEAGEIGEFAKKATLLIFCSE